MTRAAVLAVAVVLTLAAGGCSSDGSEDSPEASVHEAIGGEPVIDDLLVDPDPVIAELGERTPELLAAMDRATAQAYRALDRKGESGADAASRSLAEPAAWVAGGWTPTVPGVHVPIKEHMAETETTSQGTTTVETSASVADQVVSMSVSGSALPDPRHEGPSLETETTSRTALCQPPDQTAVSAHVKHVRRGGGAELTFEATGTFVRGGDGRFRVDDLDITTTGTVPGEPTRVDHLRASARGWEISGTNLLSDDASYRVLQSSERSSEDGFASEIAYAGVLLEDALTSAVQEAQKRTESGGYCVLLQASADRSTLAPGESAEIAVAVVDAKTGEAIDGALVTGLGGGGEVEPASVSAPGSMTFTAIKDPDYWAFLEVRTERGGDDANVRFNADGWRFEGTSYTATAPGNPAPVEVTTSWSGEVCGDPYTDSWRVRVTFSSPVATHTVALSDSATPLENAPGGVGARLLIAPQPTTAPGRPGFRLWIDEENPATRPSHHRVEVTTLEPIPGACVAS